MDEIYGHLVTLTGFTDEDNTVLKKHKDQTQSWGDEIVQDFYDTLFGYSSTSEVFRKGERPDREETLRNWYFEVTSGELPKDFWNHQWFVGLVHIKRKVSNPYMFGMMSRVQQLFLGKCLQEFPLDQVEEIFGAFKRLTDVIAGLIAEGYFINYVEAMVHVGGLNVELVDRMMHIEIENMLEKHSK
ncbi:MAG: globin [Chloroflexi bacterium]|nr:MAG: globin [Chloroflexota bacterium]MBL1194147.1 globin [Chloroflexota bacterium]NOH11440.1 globin [Chloroflexota bacterium]